ncbi:MAG: SDR family oxidoreductase [Gammaproteobacteria bacterium]|nr:SDR family oxidoreductase [Gammaproteobacteria bacterium]
MDFADRVVLITGAARGLGREYAVHFAARGARVVVSDLRDCRDTVAACKKQGGDSLGSVTDVTDLDSVNRMVESAKECFGHIDVLVNNAALFGNLTFAPFDALHESEWDAAMAVNVKGIWNCCRAVVPVMRESGGGSIVNVSSLAAIYGMPNGLHYTASKAAVIGLTRGLAREVGRYDIRVNAVAPNIVETEAAGEFFGEATQKMLDATRAQQSIRRRLEPGDLAGTVLWLASDLSRHVTGQTIMVDGGTVFL